MRDIASAEAAFPARRVPHEGVDEAGVAAMGVKRMGGQET
jgi:hypothetical protein